MENRKQMRGFTLGEALIVLAIFAVFSAIIGSRFACSGSKQNDAAKSEARKYARDLGVRYSGISCADYDSDGDGYISCTIKPETGDLMYIECRGAYSIGHGCRSPKMQIPQSK